MFFERLFGALIGLRRLIISENHRVIVTKNGKIADILSTGKHWVSSRDSEYEAHNINQSPALNYKFERALFKNSPQLVEKHLQKIQTSSNEIKIIYQENIPIFLIKPDDKLILWNSD